MYDVEGRHAYSALAMKSFRNQRKKKDFRLNFQRHRARKKTGEQTQFPFFLGKFSSKIIEFAAVEKS